MATSERDKRLDELVKLTKDWSTQAQKEINDRVSLLEKLLKGRSTGALAQSSIQVAKEFVQDEIDAFLKG